DPGLLLPDLDGAAAGMLAPHRHEIGNPLAGIKRELHRQPFHAAERPTRTELRDFGFGPGGVAIRLRHLDLDAVGRIGLDEALRDGETHQRAHGLEPIASGMGAEIDEGALKELPMHAGDRGVAVLVAEAIELRASAALRAFAIRGEARRL